MSKASVLLAMIAAAIASALHAQQVALADRGPRFLSEASATSAPHDVSDAPVLRRRVTLELVRVPLQAALAEITRQTGIHFAYSPAEVPVGALVSLSASDLTVAAALHDILLDMAIDIQLSPRGTLTLVPRAGSPAPILRQQGTATLTGHVTDGALRTPLSAVSVRIEGTTLGTTADADGKYTIAGIASGTYRVTARRVGYQPLTKDVTVGTEQTVTLDFALTAAPTRLDEVVTTAVGQQRRYEVGNDISTINADSIAPTAPITSLTDLISARAPGVTVLETSGMTGSGEAIRIEGLTSLVLQNDPIVIVDGVRQDNSAGGGDAFLGSTHPTPTRLNDIDFTDVESIDILKGPSATTEYGTDAANGVIVITTKHGVVGRPQWKASAEQTASDIPVAFPNGYYTWGHTTNGSQTPTTACTVVPVFGGGAESSGYDGETDGSCIADSVTRFSPFNHSATSIFGTGERAKYDLSVSGGSDAARYFVAGGLSNETGLTRLPPVFRELADTAGAGLPNSAFNPNGEQQRSVRINTAIKLGATADLTATASYLSTYQQTPNAALLYEAAFESPALNTPAAFYGYSYFGQTAYTPIAEMSQFGSQNTNRLTGGLSANWHPSGWFQGHATAGLDHGSQQDQVLAYPLANPVYAGAFGLGLSSLTTDIYSVDIRGTATAAISSALRAATSAGLQIVDTRQSGQTANTNTVSPTNLTLNGATNPRVSQVGNREATLGGYGEEQLSIAERLFVTGALRIDAASGFGRQYATAAYPKATASWLALDQGATTLRLRAAFGESGVQPQNGAALQLYSPTVGYLGGTTIGVSTLNALGNPNLQPERSEELEGGAELGAWGSRLSVAVTAYSKSTHDALVNEAVGGSLCCYEYQENIGQVSNTGVEGTLTIGIIQRHTVTWDAVVNASMNHNKLTSLAPGVNAQVVNGEYTQYRQEVGYPLYGIWAQPLTYKDANHDGIIEPGEITIGDSAEYVGPSLPTQEASISTHIAILRGAVTLGGLLDYRGGFRLANAVAYQADGQAGSQVAENDPTAPLSRQARAIATATFAFSAPYIEDASFARIREVSVTYLVPRELTTRLRLQSCSLTAAVRNLWLWTRYSGTDPEVSNPAGYNVLPSAAPSNTIVNNDVREDNGAVPLARYWVLRLNVGL